MAASGLRMLPRDLLKIGLLMMNHGRAGDRQVVPASWVDAAITPHATVNNYGECAMKYGYYWWLRPDCKPSWFAGSGNGGQNLWIMPSLDLIVVTTAGLYNSDKQEFVDQMNRSVIQAVSGQ